MIIKGDRIVSHLVRSMAFVAIAATLVLGSMSVESKAASVPESSDPIKIVVTDATGQIFMSYVIGRMLEDSGYNVEYVAAGYYPQVQGLADGDLHFTPSLWSSNMGEDWMELFQSGKVLDAGETHHAGVEAWYANDKALEVCPGVENDWTLLRDCADKFATAETFPKGRFLDYPIEWGTTNQKRIEALDLPFESQPAGSEGAMISEINAADERGEPLLVQFWAPHGVFADHNLTPIPLPEYFEGCHDDPSGGINPNATYDCDWSPARVWKGAWPGAKDKWPVAYRAFENFEMTGKDLANVMKAVDTLGGDVDEYVDNWMKENESRWRAWMEAAMN